MASDPYQLYTFLDSLQGPNFDNTIIMPAVAMRLSSRVRNLYLSITIHFFRPPALSKLGAVPR
jgi:hypothetical protein